MMQRLFSLFPDGRAGAALLLLRLAASYAMFVNVPAWLLPGEGDVMQMAIGAILIVAAASLLAGFMTPVAGVIAAVASFFAPSPAVPYIFAIAVALVLLGPGAFSVDARLFGRREIVIKDS